MTPPDNLSAIGECPDSLTRIIDRPVKLIWSKGFPILVTGSIPLVAVNEVLAERMTEEGATAESVRIFANGFKHYAEFCHLLGSSLKDVTNDDFKEFVKALRGKKFRGRDRKWHQLPEKEKRKRSDSRADHIITLVYSVAGDIEERWGFEFEWRRYRSTRGRVVKGIHASGDRQNFSNLRRVHSVKHEKDADIDALPDEQFTKLIEAAIIRWGANLALMMRNLSLLFVLRFLGARRSEAPWLDMEDIHPEKDDVELVTKGHGGPTGKRIPVTLPPSLFLLLRTYILLYRPFGAGVDEHAVFVAHAKGSRYGKRLSASSVTELLNVLKPALDPPWNKSAHPHMLRHSYGVDLQRIGGPFAVTANMRHLRLESSEPYAAKARDFPEVLNVMDRMVRELLKDSGIEIPSQGTHESEATTGGQ